MSQAWEVALEDVAHVLRAHGMEWPDANIEPLLERLDHAAIESGVLYYTDMDDQIASANEEIEKQLMGMGVIPADTPRKFEHHFVEPEGEDYLDDFEDA